MSDHFWTLCIKRLRVEKLQNIEIKLTEANLRALPHLTSKSISYSRELMLQRTSGSTSDKRLNQQPEALLMNEHLHFEFETVVRSH